MEGLAFRRLVESELPLLHRWFHAPHAERWYGKGATNDEIDDEYRPWIRGEVPIRSFVASIDGRDVGLLDTARLGDFPELMERYGVTDPDTANCDVIIGEPDAAQRGAGPAIIRAFLDRVVFADPRVTTCVIDPEADNAVAIRAYEKAGFRFVRTADDGEDTHVYLLERGREDWADPAAPHLRPGRPGELDRARAIDDDACAAYLEVGLRIDVAGTPAFFAAEEARWRARLDEQRLLFACEPDGRPVGFAAFGFVDGRPYLDQISVERAAMQRGHGRRLLERVMHWSAGHGELWLTTYRGVPFNDGWYGRLGFESVLEAEAPPSIQQILAAERAALPAPERRISMRYQHRPPFAQHEHG